MNDIQNFVERVEAAGVTVLLLGGLPGSGKSTYADEFENRGWLRYDDFQKRAIEDSDDFRNARHFNDLVSSVNQGMSCVVTDIRFVYSEYRATALRVLNALPSSPRVEVHVFANDPEQCVKNVEEAEERNVANRIAGIKFWSTKYSSPPGRDPLPVLRRS